MRLVATKEVYYASKTRKVGDEFEATDQDARILVGLEKAELKKTIIPRKMEPAEIQSIKEDYATSAVKAEGSSEPRRGRYKRRDMKAED
jgi:hypothetical protein